MAEATASHVYQWVGINKQGKRMTGTLQAGDLGAARSEILKLNIELIEIKESKKFSLSASIGGAHKKKIKRADIMLFTRMLSTMIVAGLPIIQAIDLLAKDQDNPSMKALLLQIRTNVAGGQTLTEAFKKYPNHFNNLYCSLMNAGEKSGTLDKVLNRLAVYMEKSEGIRRKVKKALIYPVVIICVSMAVSAILLMYVVPQFQTIFSSFGAELPYFTRVVVNMSDILRSYWWIVLALMIGGVAAFRYGLKHNDEFADRVDKYILKIPVVGPLILKGIMARFTRTLAITLDSGMPIVETMRAMVEIVDNRIYSKAVSQIGTSLVNGHQLNAAMTNTKLFPNMMIQMIAVGESSGALSDMLNKIADYYEEDVDVMVDNLSNLLEPMIMILLGIIIGGFVIAMYLPIFKIGSIVK